MMDAPSKIRLFTAVPVPRALEDQIMALPEVSLDFKRKSHPDDLHITLRFLGDVDAGLLPDIEEILSGMKKPSRFNAEVAGLNIFRKKDHTVLFAPVLSVKKFALLADDITLKLQKIGVVFPPRSYEPHITVARLHSDKNFQIYKKKYESTIRSHWQVSAFHLMKSANAQEGEKRYSILQTYDLAPY